MLFLQYGSMLIGVVLIVTGGSMAFQGFSQGKMQTFTLSCIVMGVILIILGMFWTMRSKNPPGTIVNSYGQVLRRSPLPQSPVGMLRRTSPSCVPDVDMLNPPSYDVAIETTKSTTQMRRCCSDSRLPTEPLFSESRRVSFKV